MNMEEKIAQLCPIPLNKKKIENHAPWKRAGG